MTILTNAKLVLPDEVVVGTVSLDGSLISAIDPGGSAAADTVDLQGDFLVPGLVELHTDNLEKHFTPRPRVTWNPVTAAVAHDAQIVAAGITTVYDALALIGGRKGADRRDTLMPMVEGLKGAGDAGLLRADHHLHLRCEVIDPTILELFEPFRADPTVRLVSLMDHTPGQRQFRTVEYWTRWYKDQHGLTDDEVEAEIAQRRIDQAKYGPRHANELSLIARGMGLPIASHDDETEAHIADAVRQGVTISEFPTTRTAARGAHANGIAILMGAPNLVRGKSHSGNISCAELATDRLVDILSSDYVPVSLLHGAWLLAESEDYPYDLPAAIATVTATPADLAGLDDRGRIEVGMQADLVRFRVVDGVPYVREVWRKGRKVVAA